ncbi:hypothetical protein NGA_2050100, partial [Nannochloropsis gaditana CCMP526]|uniref:uncharacterized protein n=1 Tax=Nannochloropsis gaditana (strain CCMP526) TaxID=1093141 RepID=UPI00029F6223
PEVGHQLVAGAHQKGEKAGVHDRGDPVHHSLETVHLVVGELVELRGVSSVPSLRGREQGGGRGRRIPTGFRVRPSLITAAPAHKIDGFPQHKNLVGQGLGEKARNHTRTQGIPMVPERLVAVLSMWGSEPGGSFPPTFPPLGIGDHYHKKFPMSIGELPFQNPTPEHLKQGQRDP